MATAKLKDASNSKPGQGSGVVLSDFYTAGSDCPIDAIDPTFLMCETDQCCCEWAEICEEEIVEIDGVLYYTWRPKGLKDDDYTSDDPGVHLHLACKRDSTGVRITGLNVIEILEQLTDPELISRFCDWVFEHCFSSEEFVQWVCDTVVSFCLPNPEFRDVFCQWFVDFILEHPACVDFLTDWLLNNEKVAGAFCQMMIECLSRQEIIEVFCNLIANVCLLDQDIRDLICEIIQDCFRNDPEVRDKVCDIIKSRCITADYWDSTIDPDPQRTSASDAYLVDVSNDCVTHICIGGIWYCVPRFPSYVPVVTPTGTPCPIPFPLTYNGNTYLDEASFESALSIEYGCTIDYNPVECIATFPFGCGTAPSEVVVTSVAVLEFIPVITDGVYTCPAAFPVIYNGNTYNSGTNLAAALSAEYGCTIIYRSSDCTMRFPGSCGTIPTSIDVDSEQPTYVPVTLDGSSTCPLTFPVFYGVDIMNDIGQLTNALVAEYACAITYVSANCTFRFPPSCATVPPEITLTTV